MSANEALIAEAQTFTAPGTGRVFEADAAEVTGLIDRLIAALDSASVDRAVVEAQALEQAARFLRERNWAWNHTDGAMEAARAVELLAIDKSRETP